MHSFLFFLCGLFLVPSSPVESKTSAEFYMPQQALSAMRQTEKVPELRKPLPNRHIADESHSVGNSRPRQYVAPKRQKAQPQKKYPEAPIDNILAKQDITPKSRAKYKKHIVRSFYLLPQELNALLQKEFQGIDAETRRMQQIKAQWSKQTSVYKLANYQLTNQIDRGIAKSRQEYLKRKKLFGDLLKKAPSNRYISMIESTDSLFSKIYSMTSTMNQHSVATNREIDTRQLSSFFDNNILLLHESSRYNYVSVFDHKYNHVFSYERIHIEANRNRRIRAFPSKDPQIDAMFQTLFDGYRADLKRIGYGLDITNPTLLRQLAAMQNQVIKKEY